LPNALHAQTSEHSLPTVQNFEGFALQAAIGYQPYKVSFTQLGIANTNIKLNDQNYYSNSVPYFFGASYTTAISRDITIGAQIEVNPINQQYVLSLLPGYALTSDIQGYLKLAWVNAMVTVDQGSNQSKISATANGATVGLGLKQFWTPNWYGFIEANYVKMDTIKFNRPINGIPLSGNMGYSGYNAMVGIGFKF
jgi:opacity protein-like surface antigen